MDVVERKRQVDNAVAQNHTNGSSPHLELAGPDDAGGTSEQATVHPAGDCQAALLEELRASELRFRTFMDNCPFLTFIKDAEGRFLFYNRRFTEEFQITPDEWLGRTDQELWPQEIAAKFDRHDAEVRECGHLIELLEETPEDDGRVTSWRSYKFPWRTPSGEDLIGAFVVDVSSEHLRTRELEQANQSLAAANAQLEEANLQLAAANARLEELATIDALTGLGNRRVLDERVEFEFRLARRHKTPFSVVLLDLDDFKRRNDLYGHAAGDAVLKRLAELILATLRSTDMAARYGGEEFVILLPGAESWGAELFLGRLLEAMRVEPWPDEPVTASFGIASMSETTRSGARLIELADDAMYEAKRAGKNRTVTHQEWLHRALAELGDHTKLPPK